MLCLLGPPLEGTSCGGEGTHWCREGACVPVQVTGHSKDDLTTSPPVCAGGAVERVGGGGLQLWVSGGQRGGQDQHQTLPRAQGVTLTPAWQWLQLETPVARYEDTASCVGSSSSVSLCDDLAICGTRSCSWAGGSRQTRRQVSRHPTLTPPRDPCCSTPAGSARGAPSATPPSGPGPAARELLPSTTPTSRSRWRSQYFFSRLLHHCVLLQACAIYCRHKAGSGWMKIPDTFFPDGD